jgi:hypothetical protein
MSIDSNIVSYRGGICLIVVKPVIEGNPNYIVQQITDTVEYEEHNLLIYPNLHDLTEIY